MERTIVGVLLLTPLLLLLPTVLLYAFYVAALHAAGVVARRVLLASALLVPQAVLLVVRVVWPWSFPGAGRLRACVVCSAPQGVCTWCPRWVVVRGYRASTSMCGCTCSARRLRRCWRCSLGV